MKISRTTIGFYIYLTAEDANRVGPHRRFLTVYPRADPHDYFRLRFGGNSEGVAPIRSKSSRVHPYRMQFHPPGSLPKFGLQEVEYRMAGDSVHIHKPDLTVPPARPRRGSREDVERASARARELVNSAQKIVRGSLHTDYVVAPDVGRARSEIGLREAIEAVNRHKKALGAELCLSVDIETGRLEAIVRFGG
jgi:hypothetical protein